MTDNDINNDILLLDISNNDEYKWTNIFENSTPSKKSNILSKNIPAVVGIAIGAFVVGISIAFGSVFLYKRNKNRQIQRKTLQIHGNVRNINNYGQNNNPIDYGSNVNNVLEAK